MATMRAIQVSQAGGPLELVERPIPEPGRGEVRIKVQACGICHSDDLTKSGRFPGIVLPRVPGHEVAGVIDAVGAEPGFWKVGQRVGVGWFGGSCGQCERCRRGDFMTCRRPKMCGVSYDGGYADYMIAPRDALAAIPDSLSAAEAAPLLCAGITTFNALRHSGLKAGDRVAIHGIGGLGHLGIQYAVRMGCRTIAIARGQDKAPLARQLGAHDYIDSAATDPAKALQAMGGAEVILATVTSAPAMASVLGGLAPGGRMIVVGATGEPLMVNTNQMLMNRQAIVGWPCGTGVDSEDTLAFSLLAGIRAMIETVPLEQAPAAFERMMSGQARFRMVLVTGH